MNRERGSLCRALLGTASTGAIIGLLTLPGLTQTRPQAPKVGDPPEALNMRLVGHNDLQARTAYQPTIFKQGAVNNIATFHTSIQKGDCSNPTVSPSVRSNLLTILGRTAAYESRVVTWKEIVQCDKRLEADLKGLKS